VERRVHTRPEEDDDNYRAFFKKTPVKTKPDNTVTTAEPGKKTTLQHKKSVSSRDLNLTPLPGGTLSTRKPRAAEKDVQPLTFVRCSQDRAGPNTR
jgi:hypothetical protein